ncbi:kunitz/Bovine pancreatic trypsin inhibitor domain-containing protein [Ditylenchus destructor]|uniref:Kunitz/Bovine pancreatic trypsin inhibitor domain-containing protein n=1 Tax=Ditylenchus destructor TaxID=166010 RepID=A0AAD4QW13_9BILA|nr:kunitz/Bovine pancreatic trypsin inhibitor domain-containing protein [Ditylenchus destructor]
MLSLFLLWSSSTILLIREIAGRLPDPPVFAAVEHYPSACYLPPDSGLCPSPAHKLNDNSELDSIYPSEVSESESDRKLMTRYYFDVTTEQCYPFGTQSCGGNDNRFDSLAECQTRCRLSGNSTKAISSTD